MDGKFYSKESTAKTPCIPKLPQGNSLRNIFEVKALPGSGPDRILLYEHESNHEQLRGSFPRGKAGEFWASPQLSQALMGWGGIFIPPLEIPGCCLQSRRNRSCSEPSMFGLERLQKVWNNCCYSHLSLTPTWDFIVPRVLGKIQMDFD